MKKIFAKIKYWKNKILLNICAKCGCGPRGCWVVPQPVIDHIGKERFVEIANADSTDEALRRLNEIADEIGCTPRAEYVKWHD